MSKRSRRTACNAGEAGFTLVETLVAFAVVSMAALLVIRIGGDVVANGRKVETAEQHLDEAEGIVQLRVTTGQLRAGVEEGMFVDGQPWSLSAVDVGPSLGWRNMPPVYRVRLTDGGPHGHLIYATLVAGGLGGT